MSGTCCVIRPSAKQPFLALRMRWASIEGGAEYGFPVRPLRNGDVVEVGNIRLQVIHTPGHTPEHISFLASTKSAPNKYWALFTGDFLFALTLTTTEDVRPVTLGIYQYIGAFVNDWSSVMATAVIAAPVATPPSTPASPSDHTTGDPSRSASRSRTTTSASRSRRPAPS